MNPLKVSRDFEIHGHRGARARRPENTFSGFAHALDAGVDFIEIDLCATKDNVLVVVHDPILNPQITLDSQGQPLRENVIVRETPLSVLKTFDCGTLQAPAFPLQIPQPGERIPTLEEVLLWLKGRGDANHVGLNIEAKVDPDDELLTPPPDVFAQWILDALKRHDFLARAQIQSFDFRVLVEARARNASVRLGGLLNTRPPFALSKIAIDLELNVMGPRHDWLQGSDIEDLHRHGIRVIPWTVNDERIWRQLIELGVDGIITDDPEGLRQLCRPAP